MQVENDEFKPSSVFEDFGKEFLRIAGVACVLLGNAFAWMAVFVARQLWFAGDFAVRLLLRQPSSNFDLSQNSVCRRLKANNSHLT